MYIFFDTETSGLPKNFNIPFYKDLGNFPRIVSLSWILTDDFGVEVERGNHIIRPNGFQIEGSEIHGITTAEALLKGQDLKETLQLFGSMYKRGFMPTLVAHNMNFDYNVLFSEFMRMFPEKNWAINLPTICTMKSLTDFCEIEGKYGYKWPSLNELHNKLFGCGFDNAHNSMADTEAMKNCFFEIVKNYPETAQILTA